MRDWLESLDAAAWIAAASVVVSLFVLWRQHQQAGRAHFTADWEGEGSLLALNHGPGPARHVLIELDGNTGNPGEFLYVGAFQAVRLPVWRAWGDELGTLKVEWRDNRIRTQVITIPVTEPPRDPKPRAGRTDLEKAVRAIASDEASGVIESEVRRVRRRGY